MPIEPTGGVVIGDTVHQPLAEKTFVEQDPKPSAFDAAMGVALATAAAMPALPTGPSFDTWLDEDAIAVPANDRVSQMVREFFAGLVPIDHSVSWLPAQDGKALSVFLTTIHGTSQLAADAGTWSEADVSAALTAMRADLGV